ncbi:alpha/beta hydrolase [Hoeflea sp. WL0058]|uniref:Alpha/beta hydrolase n=1 Tax=Flavimaribacter sediminis TaxID=2865987 RepID=A0AAE2ZU60_9HYPH|nr:alpha/beta hydrolase [Flavimaribacter sediminis]
MEMNFLFDGPESAPVTILLAHGAGAPMDSQSMNRIVEALAGEEIRVARFEFGYMALRRSEGRRKPPPRADRLIPEYKDAIDALAHDGALVIGGKSMGGRVASMIADEEFANGRIAGLLCLGYPFHPPGKPDQLRTKHLEGMRAPTLICQGARDPFGTSQEVCGYDLSGAIEIVWLEDGDHDLKPRKTISGFSMADHLQTMAQHVRRWCDGQTK